MTEEDLAELARATHELKLKQETPDPPEALRCVPSLSLKDIPKKPIQTPTEVMKMIICYKALLYKNIFPFSSHLKLQCLYRWELSMGQRCCNTTSSQMMFCILNLCSI